MKQVKDDLQIGGNANLPLVGRDLLFLLHLIGEILVIFVVHSLENIASTNKKQKNRFEKEAVVNKQVLRVSERA